MSQKCKTHTHMLKYSSSIDDSSLKHTASRPYYLDKQTTFIQESPKKIPPSKLDSYAEQIHSPKKFSPYVYSQKKYTDIHTIPNSKQMCILLLIHHSVKTYKHTQIKILQE